MLQLYIQCLSCLFQSLQIVLLIYIIIQFAHEMKKLTYLKICILSSKKFNSGNYLQQQKDLG